MKPKQIIIDEDFKKLMPPLAPDEYKLLEESIKTEGCREPIILWHTFLIDGYTRYEICQRNNIEFKTKSIIFKDSFASPAPSGKVSFGHFPHDNRDTVKIWIIKNQLGRRNLTDYDRGRLALQLKPIISEKKKRGRPKKEMRVNLPSLDTRAEIAKIADLSERTIDKIEVIVKEAPPEIKEAASSGEISIHKAYKKVRDDQKPGVQKKISSIFTMQFEELTRQWKKATKNERRNFLRMRISSVKDKLNRYQYWNKSRFSESEKEYYATDIDERTVDIILKFGVYYNEAPKFRHRKENQ